MSSTAWKNVSSKRSDTPRGRLNSGDVLNCIEERVDYLKNSNPEEAAALDEITGKILRFIRGHSEDEDPQGPTIRQAWRHNAAIFLATLDDTKRVLVQESVLELFLSVAYEKKLEEANRKLEEANRRIAGLEEELTESRAVYEPRQALEKVVGGSEDRTDVFYNMIANNEGNIRDVFRRHFRNMPWTLPDKGKKKIGSLKESTDIAQIGRTLYGQVYGQVYSITSKVVHNCRPHSAPPYSSIVIRKHLFNAHQMCLLQVVGEYLNKTLIFL